MLKKISKFGVFIVIGCLAYITYSALNAPAASQASESKELPVVTNKMLNPVFLEPQQHASPVDRDPFSDGSESGISSVSDSNAVNESAGGAVDKNVPFSERLMGILSGNDGQRLALIGGEVYGVGSQVKQSDSSVVWMVTSIENESVTLTHNGLRAVLKIADIESDNNDVQNKISEPIKKKVQKL